LRYSDIDPAILIRVAENIGRQISKIKNLVAYTNYSFFWAVRNATRREREERALLEQLTVTHALTADTDEAKLIEQQILIRELLALLNGLDREIYIRRLNGLSFQQIDEDLSLKPRTSEYRYREAKLRFRALSGTTQR
jgi:hypothetical protein